jgi:hypothetical protein
MLECWNWNDVIRRFDLTFGNAIFFRPPLNDMMIVIPGFPILPQLLQRLGRVEVRFNIRVSLIGPISSLHCQKKIPNRPPDRSFYTDPNPDA